MSRDQFLAAMQATIVADRVLDPVVQNTLVMIASHSEQGEMPKVMHTFPRDMQPLFPALASTT
jgi:hypothetical protein